MTIKPERKAAIEYLTARYKEQCENWPTLRGPVPLELYLRRNVPVVIANWRKRAVWESKHVKALD